MSLSILVSSVYMSSSGIAGSYGSSISSFLRNLHTTTPHPRSGAVAERSNPMSKEWWLCGCRRAKRSYSMFKVRRGSSEAIPLVQVKEQQLLFAAAAVKRYPTSKVRETQVRW